ncbi:MAG: alpha-mannosidase, partial [Lentisphaeria bacterium]|nr:alpha-mannosidase [Lentisphaeria bacterium]
MKVHIILNSHLDPAWLWNKEQGMDEVVATARTACDLLDDYPEIFITRGEAWFYEVLEFCAPDIYERVKKHVASGRWQVVGNWYIQPDCNQPSPESFAMQAEV